MKVNLAEIYPEVGVSFDLSTRLFKALWKKLEDTLLPKSIEPFAKRFGGENFTLGFVISATRKREALHVKGPTFFPRQKTVDFVLHIPYRDFADFSEKAEYILDSVSRGVTSTIEKYDGDSGQTRAAIDELIQAVRADPGEFE